MDDRIHVQRVLSAETIAAGGTSYGFTIDLEQFKPLGNITMQATITGDGTCKFFPTQSIDGTNFMRPTGVNEIATSLTKTSGPGSDGKVMYAIGHSDYVSGDMLKARYLRVNCTETGGVNPVVITLDVMIQ